jgi:hypothetical protein
MALSESVQTSLEEAQGSLKNALAYAARQEEPYVMTTISNVIQQIDQIMKFDKAHDKLMDLFNKNGWGDLTK